MATHVDRDLLIGTDGLTTRPAAGDTVAHTIARDFRAAVSASTGNPNIDFSASSGTFKTTTGINTLSGNVVNAGNITFDFSGS